MAPKSVEIALPEARRRWLAAQRLDETAPFGAGPQATRAAIEHLGYVQIDTINVVERCHHQILYTRIPAYRRTDLHHAQSVDRSVFEYWTHALAFVPTRDIGFFLGQMRRHRTDPTMWNTAVDPKDYRRVIRLIRDNGPITIRDIDDDELREKTHLWASRKPSKAALQLAFWNGILTVSERNGMLKTYELADRHFGWDTTPRAAAPGQVVEYLIDTALRAQGIVSVASIVHIRKGIRPAVKAALERRAARGRLLPIALEGALDVPHFAEPTLLDTAAGSVEPRVHILSPFDPLIIQRARTKHLFAYDHVFEAYVPRAKRRFGYFTHPVLLGDRIVAVLDLKADRAAGKLLIQAWHWTGRHARQDRVAIEEELGRFERFQFGP